MRRHCDRLFRLVVTEVNTGPILAKVIYLLNILTLKGHFGREINLSLSQHHILNRSRGYSGLVT